MVVDADLEVDEDGTMNVVVFLDTDDDRDPVEATIPFDSIVTDLIEFHRTDLTNESVRQLYCLAHELNRASERLYDVASMLEDARLEDG